jgi:hypothetical protein
MTISSYAHASDIQKKTPGNSGIIQPANAPKPGPGAGPEAKKDFKPLSNGSRGQFAGGVSTICLVAAGTGDFLIGL